MKKHIYVIDCNITLKAFNLLQEKLVDKGSIEPVHFDEILWELIKAKRICAWFDPDVEGELFLGLKFPKARRVTVLKSPKK